MAKENVPIKTPRIMTEKNLQRSFEQSQKKAKKILGDKDKMDLFLERLEKKPAGFDGVPHTSTRSSAAGLFGPPSERGVKQCRVCWFLYWTCPTSARCARRY